MQETPEEKLLRLKEWIPAEWVKKHHIRNEAGLPIEFDNHKFLYDIYNDLSPLQVVLKAPQVGMTVLQIIKSLWCAKKNRWDIIYTLPTANDVNDMAGGKINRIVAQNPVLSTWVKDHDTVEQKSVGEHIIYYRGTFTSKAAMMVSSDLNIHDEVDASDAGVISQYETRLQAKADGKRWYFSHPSIAGFGVDRQWQQSDKKEWFIMCPHCQSEQYLQWPQNIDKNLRRYICASCKGELSNEDRTNGMWKPTSVGEYSGYHISQLMCPWISADKIITDFNTKEKQYFWNYVLGLPYAEGDEKIEPAVVLRNCIDTINEQTGRIIIGVDTGLPIHFSIANEDGFFYYGTCEPETEEEKNNPNYDPYDKLESFLRRWKTAIIIADQGGDLIGIRKLQQKYPGRVFLCYYRRDKKTNEMITWGEGDKYGEVTVDRNRMISLMVQQMREVGRIRLNGTKEEWQDWASHFGNMYRELIIAKETPHKDTHTLYAAEYVWKRNGDDHYAHTALYTLVGLDKYGKMMATIVGEDPLKGIGTGQTVSEGGVVLSTGRLDW